MLCLTISNAQYDRGPVDPKTTADRGRKAFLIQTIMTARIKSLEEVSEDIATTIQGRGGLFDESTIDEVFYKHLFDNSIDHFAHLTQLATEHYYGGSGRTLKFGILKAPKIGAFACVGEDDIDFIGIYFGTISLVSAIFTRLMSNPNNLAHVGDASLEIYAGQTHFIPAQEDLEHFSPCRPACAIRSAFSKFLALTGLDFIFGHEITHITRGHLGVIKMTKHPDPEKRRCKLSSIENQALELDADCGATQRTLEFSSLVRGWRHQLRVEADDSLGISWREFYANEFKTIGYCFFTSYLTLRMTSPDSWDLATQQKIAQPLPPYRMGILMQAYVSVLKQLFDWPPEEARTQISAWCVESEQALANLLAESGQGKLQLSAIESFISGVGGYNDKVIEAQTMLEKELSEFAMPEIIQMTHPRPRTCDYVVLKGLQQGMECFGILEAKRSDTQSKAIALQCFFQGHDGIIGLPFPLIFDPKFEGDLIGEALASDGRNYIAQTKNVMSFEPVELRSISKMTTLLRFSLQHSECSKLKADLIQILNM